MTKPIVIESEGGEGVLETDTDAWKRGPVAKNDPFKRDSNPVVPTPATDTLKINERLPPEREARPPRTAKLPEIAAMR